jgi:hypothetical protein
MSIERNFSASLDRLAIRRIQRLAGTLFVWTNNIPKSCKRPGKPFHDHPPNLLIFRNNTAWTKTRRPDLAGKTTSAMDNPQKTHWNDMTFHTGV